MNNSSNMDNSLMNRSEVEYADLNNKSLNEDEMERSDYYKYENHKEHGLVERIYDSGQGEKFNNLIKNPQTIKAMKAFITADDVDDLINHPMNKTNFEETKKSEKNFMNKTSNNMQDLLSITGFKVIDKLPPTGGKTLTNANEMIDRFKISATDFGKDTTGTLNNLNMTKSNFGMPLEPKLSRPTTTIINLGTQYSAIEEERINKEKEKYLEEEEEREREKKKKLEENPLEELTKEIDESDQDEYMNKIHKFIRDAFENRDHKMDFVYYLPSDKENYYELRPKEFVEISKEKTYYTLSSKGLTVYIDKKPKEFIKLAEWINERQKYNVIAEIPFFKNFKIWRIIKMWRKNIFKQKKIAYQNELQSSLLFDNDNYNIKLINHKSYCNTLLSLKIVDMKFFF